MEEEGGWQNILERRWTPAEPGNSLHKLSFDFWSSGHVNKLNHLPECVCVFVFTSVAVAVGKQENIGYEGGMSGM